MTATGQRAQRDPETFPVDPWARWGWLMAAVWLVFLVFPLSSLVTSEGPVGVRVAGLAALAAFVVVYVHGFVVADRPESRYRWWPATVGTGLLVALALGVFAVLGPASLGMPIYVVAYALMLTPLRFAAAVVVVVTAATTSLPLFSSDYEGIWFFLPILVTVTLALLLTRVFEERGRTAQELAEEASLIAERERVARDVHDVLGHSLTVVTTKAELAERLIDLDPERAKAELAEIQSLTREALAEIRATVAGLRVARLGDELEAARVALEAADIEAVVPTDPAVVDPRRRLVIAWVLREAVTNVVRHSGAGRCTVELLGDRLVVTDDGCGRGEMPAGHGLRGIEERMRAAGGTLSVTDVPGGGTRLEVCWQ